MGSINESTGFTLFLYDQPNGILTVRKDMAGLQLSHSFPALDFVVLKGPEQNVYAAYFQLLGLTTPEKKQPRPYVGWTSGSVHITDLSEAVLEKNLNAFWDLYGTFGQSEYRTNEDGTTGKPAAFFEIGDGWQTATGDWLSVNRALPADLGKISARIRDKDLLPAIWLAPFVASVSSDLVKKHPDWLLKDTKNKPLRAGWNRQWGGWFYALDFYNPQVQSWLAGVFHVVCEKWNFELLKLDFLYAVCLAPPPGKTRGQVMYEAVQFLQGLMGRKRFVAGGVPLGAALGLADGWGVVAPVHLVWEPRFASFLRRREREGALPALRSLLHRWRLNGAFDIDPDVFILRNDRQQLKPDQQHTVLIINALIGNFLYTSDDVSEWSAEQTAEYMEAVALLGSRVQSVKETAEDVYEIDFEQRSDLYTAYCNLSGKKRNVRADVVLNSYETIILKTHH